jgi:hypothetical protein
MGVVMLKGVLVKEIRELEARRICEDVKFASLIPVSCYKCGNKDNFSRRLFKIEGVPESKYADDEIQNDLGDYFKNKYSIEYIFFKTYGKNKDYMVDSAICKKCKSTAITYDLSQNAIDIMSKHFKKDTF